MKWTDQEIEFLKQNYPTYGGKFCQPHVQNRKIDSINAMAIRLGIKVINKRVHPTLQNVPITDFININKKEVAYFLGFLWADGYVHHYFSKNINHYVVSIEIKSEDAEMIKHIFLEFGKWNIQKRKRGDHGEVTLLTTNNKDLYYFLYDCGYTNKSISEPTLILNKIPEELKMYFWKGLFDGDGSVGLSGRGAYFEIASTYDYKYFEITKFITNFGVEKYNIYRQVSKKNHKSSVFKVYGKEILKMSPLFFNFGLIRKNNNFLKIKEKYENKSIINDRRV
jgi:hypothetical protein